MSGVLYEEIFDIKAVDPEGKQFERVKRIHAECESSKMELILDVNSMLYNPNEGDKVSFWELKSYLLWETAHIECTLDLLRIKTQAFEKALLGQYPWGLIGIVSIDSFFNRE